MSRFPFFAAFLGKISRLKKRLFSQKKSSAKRKFTFKYVFSQSFVRDHWKGLSVAAIFLVLLYIFILRDLPSPTRLGNTNEFAQSTKIYDRNGKLLYNIYSTQNRTIIPLENVPDNLKHATIAIEDKDFYSHGFLDPRGIGRALYQTLFRQNLQGGSTITQQLVKSALLTPERTPQRKAKELLLSFFTELLYSKDKILEMYLNQVPYGGATYGIEAASETYFHKKAQDLDLAEAALLAGLPNAPTLYSPFGAHPELAKDRQREVLKRMAEDGYITQDQADQAANEDLKYAKTAVDIKAPHFVLYVKEKLIEKYGEKAVEQDGLKVTTTLDLDLQDYAQASVASEIAKIEKPLHVSNGAAVVTKPGTGEILAMIGSRDYFDEEHDGNVNVTLAHRQPGSSIKPINFAAGLGKGIVTAATPFIDKKVCYSDPGGPPYCPVNYDGKFHGITQLRYALGNSFNIPAVKMLKINTVPDMIATASAMGISTFDQPDRYGLSLTLGGGEVTMLDMATAFGVFANNGYRVDLQPILKVEDAHGKVLDEYKPLQSPSFGKKVLDSAVTFIISNILADNGARLLEFGPSSSLVIPGKTVSVKTGTTDDKRDNWTIGYTPSYLVATWVGNNDNTPMNPALASGITGAAPIWNDIMRHILKATKNEVPLKPDTVIGATVCSDSGEVVSTQEGQPTPNCPTRFEYLIKGFLSPHSKIEKENINVEKGTGYEVPPDKTDNVEIKEETVLIDPTGDRYCISCAKPPEPTPTP